MKWFIPLRIISEANVGGKFRDALRRKKMYRAAVVGAVMDSGAMVAGALVVRGGKTRTTARLVNTPPIPAEIVLTRIAPRELDDDNLARAFKAVRDQVADLLGRDDGDKQLKWTYQQRRGLPKEYAIEIEIKQWQMTT